MRQIHRAGEKLFIDFAGPTVGLTDGSRAHIFVAALGASSYTFACATPRETMLDWLGACARALCFYGGVPQLIVPDNPRALIANPNRYEPRANDTVEDFARHYGTSVLPARPYHPQDKGKVESAVQVVERWILMRLRHQKFAPAKVIVVNHVMIVRYTDDTVLGFESKGDADRFLEDLKARSAQFGLTLNEDNTRVLQFGRFATQARAKLGLAKPPTFDFLGFTHICGKSRSNGWFQLKRLTSAKRMRARL